MKVHFEGEITETRTDHSGIIHNVLVPVVICNPKNKRCLPVDLLVDTGADKSMISYNYKFGNEIGLEAPQKSDKKLVAYDTNNRPVHYIMRKVDLFIGQGIEKRNINICWCISPKIDRNFSGMDFFDKHKLIITGGKKKKFYITRSFGAHTHYSFFFLCP